MTNYNDFLASKRIVIQPAGLNVAADDINPILFHFQRDLVRWSLRRGRAAIFADTGLGKTFMQVEWAKHVQASTGGRVLIVAPLCVSAQTVAEARKLDIVVEYTRCNPVKSGIFITNYEMLEHFRFDQLDGIVLDESSILKSHTGKIRTAIIEKAQQVRFRLSCTATPSPNDFMELANQAEFIGVMTRAEMLAMFFTHDGGETSKWRLKGWGESRFWEWMAQWAAVIRKPSDLGYSDEGFDLPPLRIIEHVVESDYQSDDQLFPSIATTLTERRQAQRESIEHRVAAVAELVNATDYPWLIWCHLNKESDLLAKAIDGAVSVQGSDSISDKEFRLLGFSNGDVQRLVTKPSIAGFGMNWQHCSHMAFVGLSDSFEQFYQAVRRCWRFGQTEPVTAHVFTAESEGQVLANIKRKEEQHEEMSLRMVRHMRGLMKQQISGTVRDSDEYQHGETVSKSWTMRLGDCVEWLQKMDDDSADYTIFSPPFASLYTYSNSDRDMGNCADDDEFIEHFRYAVGELFRVTKPGRNLSFHCMNLPTSKQNHGFIGLRDFRGELIRMFTDAGFIFHSEVCIWKDPVTSMQRTKALGLLHKQIKKNSAMSRQGIPDYLVTMRKPGEAAEPIRHGDDLPVEMWQQYASPVWMDINPSRTLNKMPARDENDERHICPLQLDVIERGIHLWSNPGDLILSPFAGIGSEGDCAVRMGRRFIGIELKPSYYHIACDNLRAAEVVQDDLFGIGIPA